MIPDLALVLRFFETVSHLKHEQIIYRLLRKLPPRTLRTRAGVAARKAEGRFSSGELPSILRDDGGFDMLGLRHRPKFPGDWDNPALPRLWLYHLHYFDDLCREGASLRTDTHVALLKRWIEENPVGKGVGWEPYPTSLRIVNWIKWDVNFGRLSEVARANLHLQSLSLANRLERHLLGNHLWANAKALIFAGAYFSQERIDSILERAKALFFRELKEQLLPDGGHFELSPMYHATLADDLLDLIQLGSAYPNIFSRQEAASLSLAADAMLEWLGGMIHPDGEIAFFNDCAYGHAPTFLQLSKKANDSGLRQIQRPKRKLVWRSSSGYLRAEVGVAVLFCDLAQVGAPYIPGHAHADTLSFELSVFSSRLFVNGGCSTYAVNERRELERASRSHNCLEVDGENSSDVWGSFRVGRRAAVVVQDLSTTSDGVRVSAHHDGYCRVRHGATVWREWCLSESSLVVRDWVRGTFGSATSYFHLAPGVEAETLDWGVSCELGGSKIHIRVVRARSWRVMRTEIAVAFGVRVSHIVLVLDNLGGEVELQVTWVKE